MALARAEQDGDVTRSHASGQPCLTIPHGRPRGEQPGNLVSGHLGAGLRCVGEHGPEAFVPVCWGCLVRKTILLGIDEGITPLWRLLHVVADIVDEAEQRRRRPEAARDGPPHVTIWAQRVDMAARLVQHRHIRVAEPVDRLLAVADDEHRRREGPLIRQTDPFTPRPDEQRYELPLRPAGVLKLVHEQVVIARLETVPALRELLHPPEQTERVQQHIGEIEHGVRVERPPVFRLCDLEHARDAARDEHVQVACVAEQRLFHTRPAGDDKIAMRLPVSFAAKLRLRVNETSASRLPLLRQEIFPHAREGRLHRNGGHSPTTLHRRRELTQRSREQCEERLRWTAREEAFETTWHRRELVEQTARGGTAHTVDVEVTGAFRQIVRQHLRRHDPAAEQRGQPGARLPFAELGEDQGDVVVLARKVTADAQRPVERLIHEPRHLGLVRHAEARIKIGLERKLAQQREAECIDGADADVGRTVPQCVPARGRDLSACGRGTQGRHNPLAHLGRRLACEGDREHVRGIDTRLQQIDISVDEHAGLARPRRRFERDVVARVHRPLAPEPIARVDARLGRLRLTLGRTQRVTHRPRNPCGRPRRTRSRCTSASGGGAVEIHRRRCRRAPRTAARVQRSASRHGRRRRLS